MAKVGFAGTALLPVPGIASNTATADNSKHEFRNLPVLIVILLEFNGSPI